MMYPYSSTQSFLNQLTNKTKQLLKKIREKSSVNDDQQIHWHIATTDIQEAVVARFATSWHQKSMEA